MYHYSKSIAWQQFDNCIYIIDNKEEQVYCLENEISKFIWKNIDGKDKKDIIEFCINYYQIREDNIIKDIKAFVEDLKKNNLIEV